MDGFLALRVFGMTKNYDTGKRSIGSFIAEKIVEHAQLSNKNNILEEINIYGLSDKDGSATLSFQWTESSATSLLPNDVLSFFNDIKKAVINTKKETREQESPVEIKLNGSSIITYRFRIWDEDGKYETFEKELVLN